MDSIELKPLKTQIFAFADGSEKIERFAAVWRGARIGTVHRRIFNSGAVAIEACPGPRERALVVDYQIQRYDSLMAAAEAVKENHHG